MNLTVEELKKHALELESRYKSLLSQHQNISNSLQQCLGALILINSQIEQLNKKEENDPAQVNES